MIPTIPYGANASSVWANLVAAAINGRYPGVYATAADRNLDITTPTEGMLAFLTTPDHLTIYYGGSWKVLAGSGTYTPTLNNITIGTGGTPTNAANWSYSGGILQAEGLIQLGTSGFAIGSGSNTISLPAGFTATRATQFRNVGRCRLTPAGAGYIGEVVVNSATALYIGVVSIVGSYPSLQPISSTVPATWAAGNQILWSATVAGVMTS